MNKRASKLSVCCKKSKTILDILISDFLVISEINLSEISLKKLHREVANRIYLKLALEDLDFCKIIVVSKSLCYWKTDEVLIASFLSRKFKSKFNIAVMLFNKFILCKDVEQKCIIVFIDNKMLKNQISNDIELFNNKFPNLHAIIRIQFLLQQAISH